MCKAKAVPGHMLGGPETGPHDVTADDTTPTERLVQGRPRSECSGNRMGGREGFYILDLVHVTCVCRVLA